MEPLLPGPSAEMGGAKTERPATEKLVIKPEVAQPASESKERLTSSAGGPQPPSLPTPAVPPAQAQAAQPSPLHATVADDTPLSANDDDVMEREWVQKAKKIVSQTKDDPYTQEKEVSKLQANYIKKRYGKEIKIVSS